MHCTGSVNTSKHEDRRETVHARTLTKQRTYDHIQKTNKHNKQKESSGQFIPCNYLECESRTRWFYDPLDTGHVYRVYLTFNRTFLQFICLTVNIIYMLYKSLKSFLC